MGVKSRAFFFCSPLTAMPQLRFRLMGRLSEMPAASMPGMVKVRSTTSCQITARFRVSAVVIVNADSGGVAGFKSQVDVENTEEAAQKQSGANEQHACESNFRDDKNGAYAVMLASGAGSVAAILQGLLEIAG